MWMLDSNSNCNDHTKIPTDARKLRPLMPRPNTKINITPYSNPSSCSCIRNPNILQWTHPMSDYGVRREVPLVSTRWNPTPEQLQALEEMYRRGIRTPSAEQIQQIASKLRRFGKIEGKNVFYWFQNHKARERQKKRRQLELHLAANSNNTVHHHHTLNTKQTPGVSRRCIEIEHHKKLATGTASKCSTPSEDTASMQAPVIAPADHINIILTQQNQPLPLPLPNLQDTKQNHPTTTLQLFPIHDTLVGSFASRDDSLETKFGPTEFIEFLPTKN